MPLPINDTDLFLIEDLSGESKKITAQNLRDNLAGGTYDGFKLLVNKSDYTSRFVYAQNMQSSVAVDDWMMVERSGTSYKVSGQQIMDYFPSVPTADCPGPIENINSDPGFSEPQTLTLASDNHVAELTIGDAIVMTDDNCDVTSYVPTSSTITNVAGSDGSIKLTVADNVDLKYFKFGDLVQGSTDWILVQESEGTTLYYDMAYGNGQYLAVGRPGTNKSPFTYASHPAGPWNGVDLFEGNTYSAVVYAEGYFVALASTTKTFGTTAKYATDAAGPWSNSPIEQRGWADITYGDGHFVGIAGKYIAYSSPPFTSWTESSLGSAHHRITYGDGKFVVIDELGNGSLKWANSPAGPWNSVSVPAERYTALAYGNGYFVAVARDYNKVLWATDPAGPWQEAIIQNDTSPEINKWFDIHYNGSYFLVVQSNTLNNAVFARSTGPAGPWLLEDVPNQGWQAITSGNGYTLCASDNMTERIMYNESAIVVDRDVNEPSITVDGGSWNGSDGSGIPTGETFVTGPEKSGTGNFSGSSGNDITVTNSNHEWIDGDNREGRLFYLSNGSFRIGLAKLRERAVATAQAWAVDTGYMAEALVKHNGCYWLALSSNYNNSPDANDPLDWYNLGDVDPEQSTY